MAGGPVGPVRHCLAGVKYFITINVIGVTLRHNEGISTSNTIIINFAEHSN